MQGLTDGRSEMTLAQDDTDGSRVSTMGVPMRIKLRLRALKITEKESDYSVIERLLDEHEVRTMRQVVSRKVR